MIYDYLVIGHLTADLQEDGSTITGGTALFSALTAHRLGARVAILSAASPDLDLSMIPPQIDVTLLPSPVSTAFRNIYNNGARTQFMYHPAPAFTLDDLKHAPRARVVHLGPIANEVPLVYPPELKRGFVGLTVQGMLRSVTPTNQVQTDPSLLRRLPFTGIDAMALSIEDVNGDEDAVIAATDRVPIVALTRAEQGATIWFDGERYEIPAFPAKVVDPTGAGDVFATAFFMALEAGEPPLAAARRASATASRVVEGHGVTTLPTLADVEERLRRN